jgi:4'-phosphopantetheinyl transferase
VLTQLEPAGQRLTSEIYECYLPDLVNDGAWSALLERLTRCERARIVALRRPEDRIRSIAGRVLLRCALRDAGLTRREDLWLETTRRGRPRVLGLCGLVINVSIAHSGSVVLCAVAQDAALGLDVEQILPVRELASLQDRLFSQPERTHINAGGADCRLFRFYELWTFKEALLKAVGLGLSVDPQRIEVDCTGGVPVVRTLPPVLGDPSDWALQRLAVRPGYVGAACMRRGDVPPLRQVPVNALLQASRATSFEVVSDGEAPSASCGAGRLGSVSSRLGSDAFHP